MSIRYVDTRGVVTEPLEFSEAVIAGIAPGGGLFVPESVPRLSLNEILAVGELPYSQRAARIYERFGVDFDYTTLTELFSHIYADNFDDPSICPIKKLGSEGMYVLELWHGPTSAFKDMALQCLPVFFSESAKKLRDAGHPETNYLIAVATSGDTGKAALEGFANRRHIFIVVYYPSGGVSDIQFKQMATQAGNNLYVYAVRGNFDDCQTDVKRMFNDELFNKRLASKYNIAVSSANSINWGRLMPQIVYYVSAYAQLVKEGALDAGDFIDVCVPTGNFGNILACYYAKRMGTPIKNIVCASNENHVLTDFIETGVYTIQNRDFLLTPSPSMDILISSNLERQLFESCERNCSYIRTWMKSLKETGAFEIDKASFSALRKHYLAGFATNDECLQTIKRVDDEYAYLLDPHTAVAWKVASEHRSKRPMLVISTAHWAKFGANVYRALTGLAYGAPLPDNLKKLSGAQLNRRVAELACSKASIPTSLDELDDLPIRFKETIDGEPADLEASIEKFLAQLR